VLLPGWRKGLPSDWYTKESGNMLLLPKGVCRAERVRFCPMRSCACRYLGESNAVAQPEEGLPHPSLSSGNCATKGGGAEDGGKTLAALFGGSALRKKRERREKWGPPSC